MNNDDAASPRQDGSLASQARPARPPGPVVTGLSVILSAGLMFAMGDWWPGKGRAVDGFTNGIVGLLLKVSLLAVGLMWAIKSLKFVSRNRRWSWWIAPAPIAVIIAVTVGLLISPSFESSRTDFDLAVQNFQSTQKPLASDVEVGPYAISRIVRSPHGAVYFYDADQVFHTVSGGWVYSPDGRPPDRYGADRFEITHIDGPWYEFTAVWTE